MNLLMMNAKGFIIYQQLFEGRFIIVVNCSKCSFMQPINFAISMATMKHPNKWAIFELTFNKTFKYYSSLLK